MLFSQLSGYCPVGGGGGTSHDWHIRGDSIPKGYFFFIQIYQRVGISIVEVYEGEGNHISKTGHLQLLTVVKRDASQ